MVGAARTSLLNPCIAVLYNGWLEYDGLLLLSFSWTNVHLFLFLFSFSVLRFLPFVIHRLSSFRSQSCGQLRPTVSTALRNRFQRSGGRNRHVVLFHTTHLAATLQAA